MISTAGPHYAGAPRRTILIVDDDRSVADTFARMLKLEGCEVETALDVKRGLALAVSKRPDAIILDLQMPLETGRDFLRKLREALPQDRIPVAIVTGDYFLSDVVQQELRDSGASIRFKPLWLEELIALARSLVSTPGA